MANPNILTIMLTLTFALTPTLLRKSPIVSMLGGQTRDREKQVNRTQ